MNFLISEKDSYRIRWGYAVGTIPNSATVRLDRDDPAIAWACVCRDDTGVGDLVVTVRDPTCFCHFDHGGLPEGYDIQDCAAGDLNDFDCGNVAVAHVQRVGIPG